MDGLNRNKIEKDVMVLLEEAIKNTTYEKTPAGIQPTIPGKKLLKSLVDYIMEIKGT